MIDSMGADALRMKELAGWFCDLWGLHGVSEFDH